MNIYNYIDQYGIYTFEEEPFNDIDAMIFSFLSYVDYDKVVEKEKIKIKEAGRIHLGLHNKKEKNITAVNDATELLNYIKDTKRYKDCYLFNYEYDINNDIQFSAISIEYLKNRVYVSFEGTDEQISGWKENFVLSYDFPTETHKKAISYLNRYYTFSNKKIIVGGHSKGGNLALVSSMCSNFLVKRKINRIYNMDGPGLLENEYKSKSFKKIVNKYIHIIPENSMIGIILYSTNQKVVKTSITGPLSHDIIYWKIKGKEIDKGELTSFSKQLHENILFYVENHSKEDIKDTIDNLYYISKKSGIKTLLELKNSKTIMTFLNECKELNPTSRNMLYELVSIFLKAFGYSKYIDFIHFFKKER